MALMLEPSPYYLAVALVMADNRIALLEQVVGPAREYYKVAKSGVGDLFVANLRLMESVAALDRAVEGEPG